MNFLQDYLAALQRALALDAQIIGNATSLSPHYGDLVSLAARQAMAGVEVTIGRDSDSGSFNFSDVKMFMKDFQAGAVSGSVQRRLAHVFPAHLIQEG